MAESEAKRKVLIAVDLGGWSESAFDWYVKHIHKPDTEVLCFHTGETPQIGLTTAGDAYSLALEGCKDAAKRVEDKFVNKLQENKIAGRVIVRFAKNPGEEIVDMAKAEAVTMVVVGSRGMGTVRRTILGSVSDYVMHHAHCPVIVCNHERQRRKSSVKEPESGGGGIMGMIRRRRSSAKESDAPDVPGRRRTTSAKSDEIFDEEAEGKKSERVRRQSSSNKEPEK